MNNRILIIEDEAGLRMTLTDRLAAEGYQVETANDGLAGLQKATSNHYDLVILDIMLPGKNGFDVCRDMRLKNNSTPILMLTARGELTDKVVGLKLGADDYLTKPFEMLELLARVEVLLRRSGGAGSLVKKGDHYQFGDITVDVGAADVFKDGRKIEMSAQEFRLLCYLIEHRGKTVSREDLLDQVWEYQTMPSTRTVDVHVAWLRQKLEANPKHPQHILTVPKMGYKFVGDS